MLKKSLFTGILFAFFCAGLPGLVVADRVDFNNHLGPATEYENWQGNMHETEDAVAPERNMQPEKKGAVPSCENNLVTSTESIKDKECRLLYEDIYRS